MLSEKPWRVEAVLLLGAGMIMSISMGALVIAALQHFFSGQQPAHRQFYGFVVSTVSFQGMALLFVHQFLTLHGLRWSDFLGWQTPGWPRAAILAFIVGVIVVPFTWVLNRLCAEALSAINMEPNMQQPVKIIQVSAGFFQRICSGVAAIFLAPLAEELLFRGILYPLIKQRGFPRLALWGTSVFFALIHYNLMTFLPLVFLSVVLTLLYERTDVLLAPVLAHAFFNAVNFALLIFQPEVV